MPRAEFANGMSNGEKNPPRWKNGDVNLALKGGGRETTTSKSIPEEAADDMSGNRTWSALPP
jgi:hypothetical protein